MLKLLPMKVPKCKSATRRSATESAIAEKDLLCDERLDAKSPELWPEQGMHASTKCTEYFIERKQFHAVRGVTRFISSLLPLGSGQVVDHSQNEWTSELSAGEMNMLYSFAGQSESAVLEQIREFHDLSFQLGLEEAHEMTRGNLLHIFEQNVHRQRT